MNCHTHSLLLLLLLLRRQRRRQKPFFENRRIPLTFQPQLDNTGIPVDSGRRERTLRWNYINKRLHFHKMGSVSEVPSRRESKQSALAEEYCHYLFLEAGDMGGRAGVHSMLTRWMMRRVCAYLEKEQPLTRYHDDNDHGQRIMCRNPYRIQCYGRKVSIQNKKQSKSEAVTCFSR